MEPDIIPPWKRRGVVDILIHIGVAVNLAVIALIVIYALL